MLLFAASAGAQVVSSNAAHEQFVFAYRLLQRNDTLLAIKAFDKYLGQFPKDEKRGDGLYYRALLSRKIGNNPQALKFLEGAPPPRLVPQHAVMLLRGQIASDLGDHAKALAALEQIKTDGLSNEVKSSVLYLRGLSYRAMNNLLAAAEQLKQVVAIDSPNRPRGLLDLGRIQALADQRDEAIKTLQACLATKDPTVSAEAARLAGDLAYQNGKYDQAIDFYNVVMTQYTRSEHLGAAVAGVMWAHLQTGKFAQLLAVFEQHKDSMQSIDDRVNAWYLAASARQELGEHTEAINLLVPIVKGATGSKIEDMVQYKLAVNLFELKRYDEMKQIVSQLKRGHPNSPRAADADFLMAVAAARLGDRNMGGAQLTEIINTGASHPYYGQALMQRARMYDQGNNAEPAINDYRAFIDYTHGEAGAGKTEHKAVLDAHLRIVDLQFRAGQYEQAAASATQLLKQDKIDPLTDAETMYRLGLAQVRLSQFEPAIQTFTDLIKKYPQNRYTAETLYYRGLLNLALSKPDEAITDLAAAAAEPTLPNPLKINALRTVALRYREQDRKDDAAKTMLELEKIVSVDAMRPDEQLWLAMYYTNQGKPRLAQKYLMPVLAAENDVGGPARAEALLLAARGLRDLNDPESAVDAFREVIARGQGFGLEARLELARTLRDMGRLEEAEDEYKGLISVEDPMVASEAIYDSAQIYREADRRFRRAGDADAAKKSREEAELLLKRITLIYGQPQFTPLPELAHIDLAEMAMIGGDKTTAEKTYQELADNYPDGPYASYARAMIKMQNKKHKDARILFKQAQQAKSPDERLTKRIKAQLKALEGVS